MNLYGFIKHNLAHTKGEEVGRNILHWILSFIEHFLKPYNQRQGRHLFGRPRPTMICFYNMDLKVFFLKNEKKKKILIRKHSH